MTFVLILKHFGHVNHCCPSKRKSLIKTCVHTGKAAKWQSGRQSSSYVGGRVVGIGLGRGTDGHVTHPPRIKADS